MLIVNITSWGRGTSPFTDSRIRPHGIPLFACTSSAVTEGWLLCTFVSALHPFLILPVFRFNQLGNCFHNCIRPSIGPQLAEPKLSPVNHLPQFRYIPPPLKKEKKAWGIQVPDAMYIDLAVWLILENSVADSVALVCYGLQALLRRLAQSITTYMLGIVMATIPLRLSASILVPGCFFSMMIFALLPLVLEGPLAFTGPLVSVFYYEGKIFKLLLRYFPNFNVDKSARQLAGVINSQGNKPIYPIYARQTAVSSSSRQFRILTLRAGSFSCPVECGLSVASLGMEHLDFEALSYVWGTEFFGRKIYVNGIPAVVHPNLFGALRHLRHQDRDRRLFVDAVCIDQSNAAEKARQVAQMGEIFRSARRVVVWLGLGSLTTRMLFRINRASESFAKEIHLGSVRAVSQVLSVPWWTRIWVVQEVSLAKDVIVQSGPEHITWERFCTVVDHVLQHKIFGNSGQNLYIAEYQSLKGLRQTTSTGNLLARGPASYNLLRLSYTFRRRQATIPDDKLFALYGLVNDELDPSALDLRPNVTYSRSKYGWRTSEDFAARCIERFQDLSVFALSEAFRQYGILSDSSQPTWCPCWSSTPNDFTTTPFWLGSAGDAIVRWQRPFSASGGLLAPPCRRRETRDPEMANIIRIRGWQVDTIDIVGVTSNSSVFTMVFGGASHRNVFDVFRSRAQWRSVLPGWRSLALAACVDRDEALRRYHRTITAGLFESVPERGDEAYWEVLNQVCPGKCFFVTRSGRFGLATAPVDPGQEVWVLMGSAVPMVLKVKVQSGWSVKTKGYGFSRSLIETEVSEPGFDPKDYVCHTYIDDLMEYNGNVEDDLKSGKMIAEDVYLN